MKNLILMIALIMVLTMPCSADDSAANPGVTLSAAISADGPVFSYIPGKPYKLAITISNLTKDELAINGISVSSGEKSIAIDSKPEGEAPTKVAANASAVANFTLTFPAAAANKQLTLECAADYSVGNTKSTAKYSSPVMVSPELEITLLPARLVLDPREGEKRVGMSIINHGDDPFEGLVRLTCSPGLTISPADLPTKIDSYGLEAFVFGVKPDPKIAPGHYAVFVDVGGKSKEWEAVDIPVLAQKSDGKPDESKDAPSFSIAKPITDGAGKLSYEFIGKGWITYDASSLHITIEVDDPKHIQPTSAENLASGDSIAVGFDPLLNGATSRTGGYKDDDYEYAVADTKTGAILIRSHGPKSKPTGAIKSANVAFRSDNGRSIYRVSLPWEELAPLTAKKDRAFGLSVLVNQNDGSGVKAVEWGGGMNSKKDPRMFIPVVLTQ